jgi:PAS domain-containing protein
VDADWITSPTARRILMHWADLRPAWLWSADGSTLLWRNNSGRLFNAKLKKDRVRLSAEAVPIKGQVARLVRLGAIGRSSLSRVQFLAGDKPVATTCTCTPLELPEGEVVLLLVGVDPVAPDVRVAAGEMAPDAMSEALFPAGLSYRLASPGASQDAGAISLKAGPGEEVLLFSAGASGAAAIDAVRVEEGLSLRESEEDLDLADMPEPMLPLGIDPLPEPEVTAATEPEHWVEPTPPSADEPRALSSLFDRLAGDEDLYAPLTEADETFAGEPPAPIEVPGEEPIPPADVPAAPVASESEPAEPGQQSSEPGPAPEVDMIAAVIEYSDDPETDPPVASQSPSQWLITGRGFRPRPSRTTREAAPPPEAEMPPAPESPPPEAASDATPPAASSELPEAPAAAPVADPAVASIDAAEDPEAVERVTRYNFEELGRILSDRVATDAKPEPPVFSPPPAAPTGIINLNAETLVLNRLPLAILVFRDQQVLFANRALTDLLGHDSVESLRAAGIGSIFPTEDSASAGPVNRLVRRDGTPLNVTARLQSVSWQGRAALMLSASATEPMRGHEGAVRAFAEIAAETRGEGYISADRSGTVSFVSAPGRALLGRTEAELVGKPLAVLVGKPDMEPLRHFLEKPARFAETARPHFVAVSEDGDADIALFAEGQAGIVSGYFGFIKQRLVAPAPPAGKEDDLEPGMLGRLSRGIRRPLNTIIGFADLLRTSTMDGGSSERTAEYARDIRTAGLEIAVLADELDDFTRLRDGRYAPRPTDVDLGALLENCMVRVRPQAGAARVLVRSSISEQLPRIRADRSSLGQALLNLLASAIDQTPIGGSVILSAQAEEDGGISIHVRDGAQTGVDLGERFVVFRDGVDKDGEQLAPVRSSVGLALTRSLLAVNACSLSVDPTATTGTLFSLTIPADAIVRG